MVRNRELFLCSSRTFVPAKDEFIWDASCATMVAKRLRDQ